MTEIVSKAKLFAKIATVMAAVRKLPKDGENKFDKYNYITGDAVFERVGEAMANAHLVALPSIIELTTTTGESGSGKPMLRTVIHGQITLADGETGDTWTSDWYGEGADRGDKSINKAMTAMMKYYLLRVFSVGSGEDADEDSPEAPIKAKAQAPATQRQQSPPIAHRQTVKPVEQPPTDAELDAAPEMNPFGDESQQQSPALKRFHVEGRKVFGDDNWDKARHWLVERYTRKMSPTNIRTSSGDLTADECDVLADSLVKSRVAYQTEFAKVPVTA